MVEWSQAWLAADASADVVVKAFLSAETNPNDPLFGLVAQTSSRADGEDKEAIRLLLAMKFEKVVGSWAAENDISAQAFLRLGIQPRHLTGIRNR